MLRRMLVTAVVVAIFFAYRVWMARDRLTRDMPLYWFQGSLTLSIFMTCLLTKKWLFIADFAPLIVLIFRSGSTFYTMKAYADG